MGRGNFSNFIDGLVWFCTFSGMICLYGASQMFWFRRVGEVLKRWIPRRTLRWTLAGGLFALFVALFVANFYFRRSLAETTYFSLHDALVRVPFALWTFGSIVGFLLVGILKVPVGLVRAGRWAWNRVYGKSETPFASPERRAFLERSVYVAGTFPFFVGVYGFLHGRLNLEISPVKIVIPHLPREFHGFRIAQLSDIHIGGFMTEEQIRNVVNIVNGLKVDLVALTGDFVTWDARMEGPVVDALSGFRAPYGVVGCLGNHEIYAGIEDSLTRHFVERGVRILRGENHELRAGSGRLNLIGVDYQRRGRGYLKGVDRLMLPDTANILMSHNPNSFPRAAELGIDLSLAGHTHGGQVTLEFIHPRLSPSRFITDFIRGHYRERGRQLYVNRGLGTIGFPVRLNSPPEVSVYELVRA